MTLQGCDRRPYIHTEFGANTYMPQLHLGGPNSPVLEKPHAWNYPHRWASYQSAGAQGAANYCLYDYDGSGFSSLFSINFPEQIQYMPSTGHYLNASFSDNVIVEFDLAGNIYNQWSFSGGRGVYELGNGDLICTNGSGVWSLDTGSGVATPIREGISGRFIEFVPAPGAISLLGLAGLVSRRRRR